MMAWELASVPVVMAGMRKAGEKAQPDQKLIGESPARLAGPEEGQRWLNRWRWRRIPVEEMAMVAAILGAAARFLHQGCSRRRCGAARLVRGAGRGAEW
jgi:hypothetical protein